MNSLTEAIIAYTQTEIKLAEAQRIQRTNAGPGLLDAVRVALKDRDKAMETLDRETADIIYRTR